MRLLVALAALAASPALAAPAKPAPPFDARDPASFVGLLAAMDAKATLKTGAVPVLDIVTPGGRFGAQFVGCAASGKACEMVAFSTAFERRGPNLAQINQFNRSQVACRGYLTDDGRTNVMYGLLLTERLTPADMKQHLGVWQGCLTTFGRFNRDPQAFIAGN